MLPQYFKIDVALTNEEKIGSDNNELRQDYGKVER